MQLPLASKSEKGCILLSLSLSLLGNREGTCVMIKKIYQFLQQLMLKGYEDLMVELGYVEKDLHRTLYT